MSTKFFNLELDSNLGGNNASDLLVPSQRAIKTYIDNHSGGSSETLINTTYANLVSLKNNAQLKQGAFYRITDYVTTSNGNSADANEPSRSAGHPFDIIIQALGTSNLSETGTCALHDGDTYFASQNLGAWKVWYDLNNDTSKYAWADATNGKGVIFRMIDEKNNDFPYDFKNIQFYRDKTNAKYSIITDGLISPDNYYFTYHYQNQDASLFNVVHDNSCDVYIVDGAKVLCNNLFYVVNNFSAGYGNYGNKLGTENYNNTFGANFQSNTIGGNSHDNVIGNACYRNFIDGYFYGNKIGKLNAGSTMTGNRIRRTFYNNTISNNYFKDNVINSNCFGNTITGSKFQYNVIEMGFNGNTINGSEFSTNMIGAGFQNNIVNATSYSLYACQIGNYVKDNTFGEDCFVSSFEDYVQYCSFGNSFYHNHVGIQNKWLNFANGTKNITTATLLQGSSNTNRLELAGGYTVNKNYPVYIQRDIDNRVLCTWEKDGVTIGKIKSSVTATEWSDLTPSVTIENWDN